MIASLSEPACTLASFFLIDFLVCYNCYSSCFCQTSLYYGYTSHFQILPVNKMSLRIIPQTSHPTHTTNTSTRIPISLPNPSKGAPSAPGLPDTLRDNITQPAPRGPPSSSSHIQAPASTHPLEARLLAWRQTQDALKMETLRRTFGMAEPVRRGMEMKIVKDGSFRPAVLGGCGDDLHEDILVLGGRDTEVGWEDVFKGDEFREPPTFHDEMEKRLRMDS